MLTQQHEAADTFGKQALHIEVGDYIVVTEYKVRPYVTKVTKVEHGFAYDNCNALQPMKVITTTNGRKFWFDLNQQVTVVRTGETQ